MLGRGPLVVAAVTSLVGCSSSNATSPSDAGAPSSAEASAEASAPTDASARDSVAPPGDATAPSDAAPTEGGAPATTTVSALLANDTSASSAFVDLYAPAARFDGGATPLSNGDAPVAKVAATDVHVGRVSKVSVKSLLGAGAKLPVYVETQSWFCTNGKTPIPTSAPADQCGSHIDIGYATNYTSHVAAQVADMRSRGVDGVIVDWQGQSAGQGVVDMPSTSSTAIDTGTLSLFLKEAEASGGTFHVAAIEDEGIKACAATSGCDVTQQLLSDIQFLDTNAFGSPAYLTSGGRPVLFFFSVDSWVSPYGKTIDWATVRSGAAGNPLFVFENAGGFAHADSDGAYSWVSPVAIGSYPGSDPFGTSGFLPYFYKEAAASSALAAWGSAYKGFDDAVVNGWGGGERYAGQQCGKTWLDTFAAAATANGSHALAGLQLVTWDDYEEGTELETGIDDHLAVTASVTSGGTLSWTVALDANAPSECTSAVAGGWDPGSVVDHYAVYASPASDGQGLTLVQDDVASSARTLDVSGKLASGAWQLFVYAVAKPMLFDQLSSGVAYVVP
jgi:hypothetical protein